MSDRYVIMLIVVAAAVTALLRFLPFIIFDHGEQVPGWVSYLGRVLPPAVMSMLLVYCLRNINVFEGTHGIPELLCTGLAVLLHCLKRNTLLSIGLSTIVYMIIIHVVV